MKKRILSYLNNTDAHGKYMRDVLRFYTSGKMHSYLVKQHIAKPEYFPTMKKDWVALQLSFQYYNLCVQLEFYETGFEYLIYTSNSSPDALEKEIVAKPYSADFNVEVFFDAFFNLLTGDSRLRKTVQQTGRKKLYKNISRVCFALTFVLIAIPVVYVLITHNEIQGRPWMLVVILAPLAVSEVFDFLASKE